MNCRYTGWYSFLLLLAVALAVRAGIRERLGEGDGYVNWTWRRMLRNTEQVWPEKK